MSAQVLSLFPDAEPLGEQPCEFYMQKRQRLISEITMTESVLLARVEQLCVLYGALFHHCGDARKCHGTGFPDLVIVGPGGVLWRELKVKQRDLMLMQRRWGRSIAEAGQDWAVWNQGDYASGRITREIAHVSRLAAINQLPAAA